MNLNGFGKIIAITLIAAVLLLGGCVQRTITINTEPTGAMVSLNDEEIGTSPVTVNFEWYGDFNVIISKIGYETLKTHREIKRPVRDRFPADLLYDLFGSNRVDRYEWSFELSPYQPPVRAEIIKDALELRADTVTELQKPLADEK